MKHLYLNNFRQALAAAITDSATEITLDANADKLTGAVAGEAVYPLTLFEVNEETGAMTAMEVVYVTANNAGTLTVSRAQEGTIAQPWSAGAKIGNRVTAAGMNEAFNQLETQDNTLVDHETRIGDNETAVQDHGTRITTLENAPPPEGGGGAFERVKLGAVAGGTFTAEVGSLPPVEAGKLFVPQRIEAVYTGALSYATEFAGKEVTDGTINTLSNLDAPMAGYYGQNDWVYYAGDLYEHLDGTPDTTAFSVSTALDAMSVTTSAGVPVKWSQAEDEIVILKHDNAGTQQQMFRIKTPTFGDQTWAALTLTDNHDILLSGARADYDRIAVEYDLAGDKLMLLKSKFGATPEASLAVIDCATGNTDSTITDVESSVLYEWLSLLAFQPTENGKALLLVEDNPNSRFKAYEIDCTTGDTVDLSLSVFGSVGAVSNVRYQRTGSGEAMVVIQNDWYTTGSAKDDVIAWVFMFQSGRWVHKYDITPERIGFMPDSYAPSFNIGIASVYSPWHASSSIVPVVYQDSVSQDATIPKRAYFLDRWSGKVSLVVEPDTSFGTGGFGMKDIRTDPVGNRNINLYRTNDGVNVDKVIFEDPFGVVDTLVIEEDFSFYMPLWCTREGEVQVYEFPSSMKGVADNSFYVDTNWGAFYSVTQAADLYMVGYTINDPAAV